MSLDTIISRALYGDTARSGGIPHFLMCDSRHIPTTSAQEEITDVLAPFVFERATTAAGLPLIFRLESHDLWVWPDESLDDTLKAWLDADINFTLSYTPISSLSLPDDSQNISLLGDYLCAGDTDTENTFSPPATKNLPTRIALRESWVLWDEQKKRWVVRNSD